MSLGTKRIGNRYLASVVGTIARSGNNFYLLYHMIHMVPIIINFIDFIFN